MKTLVKICGITNLADARVAVESGADFLGFIFYEESPRHVSLTTAQKIIQKLPPRVKKIGVFVNEAPERVKEIADACGLDLLQFHGEESSAYLEKFQGYRVVRAVRVKGAASLKKAFACQPDYFLFDTFKRGAFGGTGKVFDWRLLESLKKSKTPYFVSGGLTPDNVGMLISRVKPFAVDVSSGVELRPGRKSAPLIKKFIQAVKLTSRA